MVSNELSNDLLRGAAAIAKFIYDDESKRRLVYHLASPERGSEKLPCFRMAGILCARKSTLLAWINKRENAA